MIIRQIRKEMRMTQKDFAKMMGLTQGYLSELETGKSPITDNIINLFQDHEINLEIQKKNVVAIPVIDVSASAGPGIENISELVTESVEISDRFIHQFGKDIAIVTVSGDSMEPTISHQDWLLVHRQDTIQNEGIFVFLQDNELRVKRIQRLLTGKILVISDNPKYQMESYTQNDSLLSEAKIVGRVVGIIQKA